MLIINGKDHQKLPHYVSQSKVSTEIERSLHDELLSNTGYEQ